MTDIVPVPEEVPQLRCTFCLLELSDMTDPRQLSCGHVFCLVCLQSDCTQDEKKCRVCSQPFSDEEVGSLQKYTPVTVNTTVATTTDHKCDVCKVPATAVSYCIDCKQRICHQHMQYHVGFFESRHQTMDIDMYKKKDTCNEHPSVDVCVGCTFCYVVACSECEPKPCTQKDGNHQFVLLKALGEAIKLKFDPKLLAVSEQISRLCNLEKEAWQTVDEYTENATKMVHKVEERAEEQIAEIRKKTKELSERILMYQGRAIERAEFYMEGINDRIQTLEQTYASIKVFLRKNQVSEIAFHVMPKLKQLEEAVSMGSKVEKYRSTKKSLAEKSMCRSLECDIKEEASFYAKGVDAHGRTTNNFTQESSVTFGMD